MQLVAGALAMKAAALFGNSELAAGVSDQAGVG